MDTTPLQDLTVLDFSHALAGPYCTMLLASYGASVYKVEGTGHVDMGRTWGPPFQGGEASYFLGINAGKRGLAIDFKHPRGRELCLKLAARADVVIENQRPGLMKKNGLGYDDLANLNPRLIYCSISGYGQNGPSRDDPAMDLILQANSGLISVTGTPGGELARCGHSVADITAGMFALIGILMALEVRHKTGRGQYVDVAMLDSMISAMASNYAYLFGSGIVQGPQGTAFATIVPYRTFKTRDREITVAVASEKLWEAFCRAIERPGLTRDPLYETNPKRVANRDTLEPMLCEIFKAQPAAHWLDRFRTVGVPCTLVRNLQEVADDPQAAARGMFPVVEHATAGPVRVTGLPVKLSESPGRVSQAAPLHGQHTWEALGALLGLDEDTLRALAADGIIGPGR
ncbi:MAG: CoA transferase [Bryobacteraceae bacterium]|nr:CoA transferase [Bryobacteraceae bacterium]